jgi:glycerol-3-phosphate O-acyltransferase
VSERRVKVVVLARARSATERGLLDQWAAAEHPGAPLVVVGPGRGSPGPDLDSVLWPGEALVVPARVAWMPAERDRHDGGRAVALPAVFAMRRPWSAIQPQLLRNAPGSARVVDGEAATVEQLRARWVAETPGGGPAGEAFSRFVLRQAALACDRAERRLVGDRYKVPRLMVEQITATSRFADLVARLALGTGGAPRDVETELRGCLSEMVAVQSAPAIDAFRAAMAPLHSRAWHVEVDEAGLERLRVLNREHSLVFLPSHRSYADPLLFAEVLHENDFPRNHVLGGDNMSFWPIGPLGKRAGLVFIRRTFGADEVYKSAIREYLGHLMEKRFNLEWYIEGGRTRTGKLRRPRYGLLRYLAAALEDRPEVDPLLVPVSIVYDQLHEVGAMADEQRGAAKKAEGWRWLARYARDQRRNIGTARIQVGEPIPLRSALAEAGPGAARLEKVAFRVCAEINRISPVTATSLVTFALLSARDRALTPRQVRDVVAPLVEYLRSRDIPVPVAELRFPWGLRNTLDRLVDAQVVSVYEDGDEPVFSIRPGRHHVAAFYRNGALHHLVSRALVEVAVLRAATHGGQAPLETGWAELLRLRDLLKFEFFFSDKRDFRYELRRELELLDPEWRTRAPSVEGAATTLGVAKVFVAHGVLRSFFDAQLVVALKLVELGDDAPRDDGFLDECLGLGRQLLLQDRLDRADSVSRELYAGALRLAENRALVGPGGPDLVAARAAYLAEVRGFLDALARTGELEHARLERVLDDPARARPGGPDLDQDVVDRVVAAPPTNATV